MRRPAYELLFALAAVAIFTMAYFWFARDGIPQPGSLIGHGLGIVGFLLMLCTETLYSLRKRARRFPLGRTSTWLHVHIFTGIVGSYLVLLHSAGKFNGLAGLLALLTVVMVVSGFVGRYIYTAVPRTLDGVEVADRELAVQLTQADRQLQLLGANLRASKALALSTPSPQRGWGLVLLRPWIRWRQRRRLHRAMSELGLRGQAQAAQLLQLLSERSRLQMQLDSLATARRLLALWHVLHVPLGGVLFMLAFIHIGAALYYATLMK